jgi:hypothetical protein
MELDQVSGHALTQVSGYPNDEHESAHRTGHFEIIGATFQSTVGNYG